MNVPENPRPTPPGIRKISEELAEFAAPLFAEVNTQPGFEAAVDIAVQLWNIGALPLPKQGEALWKLTETLRHHPRLGLPGSASAELATYVEKRRTEYALDRRIITRHQVHWHKGQPRLEVVSYDLEIAEREMKKPSAPPGG